MPEYNSSNWGAYAAASIDNASNVIATSNANRRTREWNEKMLAQQRSWALEDWNRQNEYNSPAAQMQRFKDAGLSPHLIYGQTNTAAPVRSSDSKSMEYRVPQFTKGTDVLAETQQIKLSEAQIDNLRQANKVQQQEALLKAAQTAETSMRTARTEFDLSQSQKLAQTSVEMAQAELENKLQEGYGRVKDFELKSQELEQRGKMNPLLQEQMQGILKLQGQQFDQVKLAMKNEALRTPVLKLAAKLAERNVSPNDPFWLKIMQIFIYDFMKNR